MKTVIGHGITLVLLQATFFRYLGGHIESKIVYYLVLAALYVAVTKLWFLIDRHFLKSLKTVPQLREERKAKNH